MKYANTIEIDGVERVVTVLPLESVPFFDPDNPHPLTYVVPDDVALGWERHPDGTFSPPPPPSPEEVANALIARLTAAIQKRLDDFAKTRGYDGIMSACTYATSTIDKFRAEGQYCVDARDQTWGKAYVILDEVTSGTRPPPGSIADIEADLPLLEWPQ